MSDRFIVNTRATIVRPARTWCGGYYADVVSGTIAGYHPWAGDRRWRPSAAWAKRAGDARIRRLERAEWKSGTREQRARRVTGYEEGR